MSELAVADEVGGRAVPFDVTDLDAAIGLTKHVAHEVGSFGVTCNALALGGMEGIPADPSRQPIPRLGTGWDVGAAVAFLASDGGEWITGQVISVNGGAVT